MDEIKDALFSDLKSFNGNLNSEDEFEGQVFKRAKGGCCFNRRYLFIRDGLLTYYRDQPHSINFVNTVTNQSTKPKGQVSALICTFKLLPKTFITRKSHSLLFEISFVHTSESHKQRRIFWVFSVRTEDQLVKWKNAFEAAKRTAEENEQERILEQKIISEQVAEEQRKRAMRDENIKKANELEKQRARARQKEKMVEEEKRKVEVELEIRRLQEEAEQKRKEEEAKKRNEVYMNLLEHSWDYKFQKIWSEIILTGTNFENSLEKGIELIKTIGLFLEKAEKAVRFIVNQLVLPEEERKLEPIATGDVTIYAYSATFLVSLTTKSDKHDSWKRLGHEFRANNILFDVLHFIGKNENPKLGFRVPLMCIVDFKGFRALVTAFMPIEDERTLIHGPRPDGSFLVNQYIYENLSVLADVMNLKEHVFEWNSKLGPVFIHLSYFIEMHKTQGYKDLEEYVKESMGQDAPNQISLENLIYFLKVADILPVDHSNIQNTPDFLKRLRPEFFQGYSEKLSSDCFVNKYPDAHKNDFDVVQASKFLQYEHIEKMVKEIDSLEKIIVDSQMLTSVFHSFGVNLRYLSRVAEKTSIPYIKSMIKVEMVARACKGIFFQHISETITEYSNNKDNFKLPAHDSKRKYSIADAPTVRRQSTSASFTRKLSIYANNRNSIHTNRNSLNESDEFTDLKSELLLYECILDFFNLVFGNDEESNLFWQEILVPVTCEKFEMESTGVLKNEINLNALLFSMIFHCGVDIDFDANIQLGKVASPFVKNKIVLAPKIKIYSLNNLECKILSEKTSYFKNIENFTSALQSCDLKLKISQALSLDNTPLGDTDTLIEIAEILLETGDLENCLIKSKESLVQLNPLHARSVRSWAVLMRALYSKDLQEEAFQCFQQALFALNFHWGPNHPLHCRLSCTLADLHMKQGNYTNALYLYKDSLAVCMKTIGPNHVFTAQINIKLAQFYLESNLMEEAFLCTEKAYLVYEAAYGKKSLITAKAATKLSEILINLGRYAHAKELIGKACVVYQNNLLKNENIKSNLYEKSHILNEFYLACLVGLVLGLKTSDYKLVKIFGDKIWTIVCQSENPDFSVVLQIIEYVLKAKFNLIGAKKSTKLQYFVNVKMKLNEDDVYYYSNNFITHSFICQVERRGGIVVHIDKLVEKVLFFSEMDEQEIIENSKKVLMSVSELKAMMEICNDV